MCRKVKLQKSCGCENESIKHCLDGAIPQISCPNIDLSVKTPYKASYECDRCCTKATDRAQARLATASREFEAARTSRNQEAMKAKKAAMDRAYGDMQGELAKHVTCTVAREKDRDYGK